MPENIDPELQAIRDRIESEILARWYADGAEASLRRIIDRMARLEISGALAVRGFRRWKRNQGRKGQRGDRHEAENGMTDLGQGIYDLDALIEETRP